jgi:hypothetical protein
MSLMDRINNPDRRTDALTPLVERRGGEERRLPRWIEWTRQNENRGKSLDERAA